MRKCTYCGEDIGEQDIFCHSCGKKVVVKEGISIEDMQRIMKESLELTMEKMGLKEKTKEEKIRKRDYSYSQEVDKIISYIMNNPNKYISPKELFIEALERKSTTGSLYKQLLPIIDNQINTKDSKIKRIYTNRGWVRYIFIENNRPETVIQRSINNKKSNLNNAVEFLKLNKGVGYTAVEIARKLSLQ